MIKRDIYLEKLKSYVDKPYIKVLAGIRRAGKSSLLLQLVDILKEKGVPEEKIAYINFDSLDYTNIRKKDDLVKLERSLLKNGVKYFLFDEVQNIEGWDEAISALYAEKDTDIFITGSNSKLLSSELSTFFTGRYIDLRVCTLNFEEYLLFKKELKKETTVDLEKDFDEYMRRGGFPAISVSEQTETQDDEEVSDIYNSIIYRDLVERKNIRNTELLTRVIRFVLDNIGNTFSAKSISDYLKNEKISLGIETIYKYLNWLEEAMVIDRVKKYDIRGKEHLKINEKFYLADVSLLYAINGRSDSYLPGILENIVYHELISKGYSVSIGKNQDKEIDFVVEKDHEKFYIQVCANLDDEKTIEREFGAFSGINDNYPKYVLSMDRPKVGPVERDGIKNYYLPDFILNKI